MKSPRRLPGGERSAPMRPPGGPQRACRRPVCCHCVMVSCNPCTDRCWFRSSVERSCCVTSSHWR